MIPQELINCKNWMLSNNKKIPCDINGIPISRNDKNNWKYYSEIEEYLTKYGTSFCLDNNYVVVDLDNCIDINGVVKEWAKPFLNGNVYIEYSKSKKGLHIIYQMCDYFKDKKGMNYKLSENEKDGIEIYSNKRNFVLTGNVFENYTEIKDDAGAIIPVYKSFYNNDIELFKEVKKLVSINTILQHYSLIVNRDNKISCPFHQEKTPSLVIYNNTNSWYCWGCSIGGTVIDFIMKMENLDKLQAAKLLNDRFNLGLEPKIKIELDKTLDIFTKINNFLSDNKKDEGVKCISENCILPKNLKSGFYMVDKGFCKRY